MPCRRLFCGRATQIEPASGVPAVPAAFGSKPQGSRFQCGGADFMSTGTLVTILVVALVVVVLLLLVRAAGLGRRRPRLRALSAESRDRYVSDWDEIEARFVDAPEQAVREAEALVMAVLRERGHPLSERELPQEVQRAHKLGYTSRDRTEGMRQALLQYRAVVVRMVGTEDQAQREQRRREMA